MNRLLLVVATTLSLAACNGPAEKAGQDRDKAAAAASGQPYQGNGPAEKLGEAQDRATKAAIDARDAPADELKQQADNLSDTADDRADKLETEARRIRYGADKRTDAIDERAKAVRQ